MSANLQFRRTGRSRHPRLLEVAVWPWLQQVSRTLGRRITLKDVPEEEWDRLCAPGFDYLWLMGVWQRSPLARSLARRDLQRFALYDRVLPGWQLEQIVGSPYAIADYRPDPHIGSWADLQRVRRHLHRRGVGLILDFVPNHTALDHPWLQQRPQCYLRGDLAAYRSHPERFFPIETPDAQVQLVAHGRDPYFPPWRDTAQLNPLHPETRQALREVVARLARFCDGLRCDMAMLVLNNTFQRVWSEHRAEVVTATDELWTELLATAPGLTWIAEAYWGLESRLIELGFQFAYDKTFYDLLRDRSGQDLQGHLASLSVPAERFVRFLENHDEPRAAATFAPARLRVAAVLLATAPGMRLFQHGQLEGSKIHAPVELAEVAVEPPDQELERFYCRVLALSWTELFRQGEWALLPVVPVDSDPSAAHLIAWQWSLPGRRAVVVANLGSETAQGRVPIAVAEPGRTYRLLDSLGGQEYTRQGTELSGGLYVRLDPGQAHWFDLQPPD